jgi:hypothetical protein
MPRRRICFDYDDGRKYIDVWAPADEITRPNSVFVLPQPFQEVSDCGDGTSYSTIHVSGCAAMWLRVRNAELDTGGYFGWQRVEAFRAMLRDTFQELKGDDVPSKKAPTSTGILDCLAMASCPSSTASRRRRRPNLRWTSNGPLDSVSSSFGRLANRRKSC